MNGLWPWDDGLDFLQCVGSVGQLGRFWCISLRVSRGTNDEITFTRSYGFAGAGGCFWGGVVY